jgi:hypothetical protein
MRSKICSILWLWHNLLVSRWISGASGCHLVPLERVSSKYCPNETLGFVKENEKARTSFSIEISPITFLHVVETAPKRR